MAAGSTGEHDEWQPLEVEGEDRWSWAGEVGGRMWSALDGVLAVDPSNGRLGATIALRLPPGRFGFTPDLALRYDSGRPNSPFGVGWDLDVPSIGRSTYPEVPRYELDDTFELGDEELVPALRLSGGWIADRFTVGDYLVDRYRRRWETSYERIERWIHQPSQQIYWRVVDASNVTSLFGTNEASRIADPRDATKILRWMLSERFDDRGNVIRYTYKCEDGSGLSGDIEHSTARYLKKVDYANGAPHDRSSFHFQVVFDYGEHDYADPEPNGDQEWTLRPDAYSNHRGGFEICTLRRCRRILVFNSFDTLGPGPVLTASTALSYDDSSGSSLLTAVRHSGHIVHSNQPRNSGRIETKSLPAHRFAYEPVEPDESVYRLGSDAIATVLANAEGESHWLDLNGNALPGLLLAAKDRWVYFPNEGAGAFGTGEAVETPSGLERGSAPFVEDRPSDDATKPVHPRDYLPLTTARSTADVSQDDPYVGYIDLNGDGFDDVIVSTDSMLRWYPSHGEDGFDDAITVRFDRSSPSARRLAKSSTQSFFAADMNGDGLYDLVRIRSGEAVVWPNQGRGRFGSVRRIVDAPSFPRKESGDNHVLLADLTGTGCVDLIWLGNGEIRYWENLGSRSFSPPRRIVAQGLDPGSTRTTTVDLFGQGVASIVWLDRRSGAPAIRHVTPHGSKRPRSMRAAANGFGLEARVKFASSSDHSRLDRQDGNPWSTYSPTPVDVVDRIDEWDKVSGARRLLSFRYHYAYAHPAQRRSHAIGFASIDRRESEVPDDLRTNGLYPGADIRVGAGRPSAPALLKTWWHTGAVLEDDDIVEKLKSTFFKAPGVQRHSWLGESQMPLGQSKLESNESIGALRMLASLGLPIREELYALDGTGLQNVPFYIRERNAWVRQIQPGRSNAPASLAAGELEQVHAVYERKADAPRVAHRVSLAFDEIDTVSQVVEVFHPHDRSDAEGSGSQGRFDVKVTERDKANQTDRPTWYRLGVPVRDAQYVLHGLTAPADGLLHDPRQLRTVVNEAERRSCGSSDDRGVFMRPLGERRYRYWSNDISSILPVGSLESRALLANVEEAAFDDELLLDIHDNNDHNDDGALEELLRFEGGFVRDGKRWWAPGPVTTYDPTHFYAETAWRDALGRTTEVRYDSATLFAEDRRDPYGVLHNQRLHPRTLLPWMAIDENRNVTVTRYDPLGVELATIVAGKPNADPLDVAAGHEMEASAHDDPTLVVTYDPLGWERNRRPVSVRVRHREQHGNVDESARPSVIDDVVVYDGSRRPLYNAMGSGRGQWLVTEVFERSAIGVLNGTGSPFLTGTIVLDSNLRRQSVGNGELFEHDVLARKVRVDHPNGTFTTWIRRTWSIDYSDENDNVLESRWYDERSGPTRVRAGDFGSDESAAGSHYEHRAAAMAAAHAGTFETRDLDQRGRVVRRRRRLSSNQSIEEQYHYDGNDRIIAVYNGKGIAVRRITYDMTGRILSEELADGGTTKFIYAATGELLRRFDPDGRVLRYRYDDCGRRTHTYVEHGGEESLIERTIWGGGSVTVPDAVQRNLIGVPCIRLGFAGLEVIDACDYAGRVESQSLHTQLGGVGEPNWMAVEEVVHSLQVKALLVDSDEPTCSKEAVVVNTAYDALGRTASVLGPAGAGIDFDYGPQGRLDAMSKAGSSEELLKEIRYDAAGRIARVRLGNDVYIRRSYDKRGYLQSLMASTPKGEVVQDLRVARDAVGNVMSVVDKGALSASFTYDALDRLIRAEGLEASSTDVDKLVRYTRMYTVDAADNLQTLEYRGGDEEWNVRFDYSSTSNRLNTSSAPGDQPGDYSDEYEYDSAGNTISGPQFKKLGWDCFSRLTSIDYRSGVHTDFAHDGSGALARELVSRPEASSDETVRCGPFERRRLLRNGAVVREEIGLVIDLDESLVVLSSYTVMDETRSKDEEADHGTFRYCLGDHLGSIVFELDGDAHLLTQESYLPFGVSARSRASAPAEVKAKRRGFRGGFFDAEQEMLRFGSSWYSPRIGRFVGASNGSGDKNPYVLERANPHAGFAADSDRSLLQKLNAIAAAAMRRLRY